MNNSFVRSYPAPKVDRSEILRYLRSRETEELSAVIDRALNDAQDKLVYKVCYRIFPIKEEIGELDLGFVRTDSQSLAKHLSGCDRIILFAATVGTGLDRLIKRSSAYSPLMALVLGAVGNERVEALCDAFAEDMEHEMKMEGCVTRKRFSPGYGDLPLDLQREVFAALCPEHSIGLSLSESLLMSPVKSVTAIIGVERER